jgi:hypothetical protein
VVKVLAEGFEYESRRYQSLSAIAREVTGTRRKAMQSGAGVDQPRPESSSSASRVSESLLFSSPQPGKPCVEEGNRCRGSLLAYGQWPNAWRWRRRKRAAGSLIAAVCLSPTRSHTA